MVKMSPQLKDSTSNASMQTSYQNNQSPSLNKQDKSIKSYDKVYLKSQIKEAYEKVVYWRRNIFELPKGQYGKAFIREITEWVNKWSNNTEYRNIAFDAIFVMPNPCYNEPISKQKGVIIKVHLIGYQCGEKENSLIS